MSSEQSCWEIYNKEMSQLNHGHALWEPAPLSYFKRVQPGDVGYIRTGCFHLLFSAGSPLGQRNLGVDVPLTFKQLDVGPIVNRQPRLPGYLLTNSIRATRARLTSPTSPQTSSQASPPQTSSSVLMLEPGYSISFRLAGGQGAALVTKYQTQREDIQRAGTFENYVKQHYDSWVAFARETGHGNDINPVLVTGVDRTRDFAMISYLNDDDDLRAEFSPSVPGAASALVWGTWHTTGFAHTNCGPQLHPSPSSMQIMDLVHAENDGTDTVSDEYDQCVFVRYYTMRRRLGIPKVIKAGAGPHDLGPGAREDEESPKLKSQPSSDSGSDIVAGSCDDDRDDDISSATSIESEPETVIHNTTADEKDDFDAIADYVFRNSDANSVLIHHRDIELLHEPGGGTDLSTQLLKKWPAITVDEDGVGMIGNLSDPSANTWSSSTRSPSHMTDPSQSLPESIQEVDTGAGSTIVIPEQMFPTTISTHTGLVEASTGGRQGVLTCTQCHRLRLRCDRKVPCSACVHRGCAELCLDGTLTVSKGDSVLMTRIQQLEAEVEVMRINAKQLEEALAIAQASSSQDRTNIFNPSSSSMLCVFEDVEDVAESIGSFSINPDGAGKYHGRFAGSEYLSRLVWSDEDNHESHLSESLGSHLLSLSPEIMELAIAAPYGVKGCRYERKIFAPYIPTYEYSLCLVQLYYEKVAWMYCPISHQEFDDAILNILYDHKGNPCVEKLHPHRISTFFITLALGAHHKPDSASESENYNLLALAALSFSSIIHGVTCSALQALFLIIHYHYFTNPGMDETRWLLFGALCRAAQVIGLYKDGSHWNLDPQEVQRRRILFWEIYTWDSWASFVNGRPSAFDLDDANCKFPDDDGFVCPDGDVEYSYHGWKFRYSVACLAPTVKFCSFLKAPGYSQFLELDRRIRTFPLPHHLQSPLDESPEGWADDPSLAMQQYGVVCERESNLLYLHRVYFMRAIQHPSRNPLGHRYSPSVLAAYRSASTLVRSLKGVYAKHPQLTATIWFFWSAIFSACYILGGIVIKCPECSLAPGALSELEHAIAFYKEGNKTRIPCMTTMLERLQDHAKITFAQFQSGLGPQPKDAEPGLLDDVTILNGCASVIHRPGSPQSPDSTLRLSESPQLMPMDISGVEGVTPLTMSLMDTNTGVSNINKSMDLGLEDYNPNPIPSHLHQHPQYANKGISKWVLPPLPPYLGMDQVYKDPYSQQPYIVDLHHGYHQQDMDILRSPMDWSQE